MTATLSGQVARPPASLPHLRPSRQHLRRDIQGLRAVAVVLVLLDHLFGRPSGGFVGVDVFFVISGFLITGLLLREHERTGRVSLLAFYRRRAKRLAPAASIVLLVVTGLSLVLFSPARSAAIRSDVLWAVLFGENWRQIVVGTDYLHAGTAISPVQHFWSLSVEEQFYVVWPLLLIALLALPVRRVGSRLRVGLALTVLTAVSIGWGAVETLSQPTWAYFSLFSRGWELGAGGVLACAAPLLVALPAVLRAVLGWCGLAVIACSAVLLDSDSLFPVPGAVPAVLGAVAVIASGTGVEAPWMRPLTNAALGAIGSVSYSLYLWHLPVIVFWAAVFPVTSMKSRLLEAVVIVSLALLSYHWIEAPFRRRSWTVLRAPRSAPAVPRRRRLLPLAALVGLLVIVVTVPVGAFTVRQHRTVDAVPVGDLVQVASPGSPEGERAADVAEAAAAPGWPALDPSPDELDAGDKAPQWVHDGCLGMDVGADPDPVANALGCVYGDPRGDRTLIVTGDSTAISYVPGLLRALPAGWRVEIHTVQQCPAVDVRAARSDGSFDPSCPRFRAAFSRYVRQTRPDVVLAVSSSTSLWHLEGGLDGAEAEAAWRDGTARFLSSMRGPVGSVVLLDPPPLGRHLDECALALSVPRDCLAAVSGYALTEARAQRQAVDAAGGGVVYPRTLGWFCTDRGVCPAYVGDSPVLADGVHLTEAASRDLAPLLRDVLARATTRSDG